MKTVDFVGEMIEVTCKVSKNVRPLITTESVGSVEALSMLGESLIGIKAAPGGTPLPDWGYIRTKEAGSIDEPDGHGVERVSRTRANCSLTCAPERARSANSSPTMRSTRRCNQFVASAGEVARGSSRGRARRHA